MAATAEAGTEHEAQKRMIEETDVWKELQERRGAQVKRHKSENCKRKTKARPRLDDGQGKNVVDGNQFRAGRRRQHKEKLERRPTTATRMATGALMLCTST